MLILSMSLWSFPVSASSQSPQTDGITFTNLGPIGGSWGQVGKVAVVAVDWSNPRIIYAAGGGWYNNVSPQDPNSSGIYVTKDGGLHWTEASHGLPDPYVSSIWVNPTNPSHAVAVSVLGVSQTSNWGSSWTMTLPADYSEVTEYPGFSNLGAIGESIYVAQLHTIYQSSNDGQTWTVSHTNLNGYYASLSSNGAEVCATWADMTGRYLDCAMSSSQWTTRTDGCDIDSLWLGPPSSQEIIAGNYLPQCVSHDNGRTWEPFPKSSLTTNKPLQVLTVDPQRANVMWAAYQDGPLLKSTDYGDHWSSVNGVGDIRAILPPPKGASQFFLGTDQGLYRGSPSGPNGFKPISQGVRSAMVYSVAAAGSKIIAITQDYQPFVSSNAGKSWSEPLFGGGEDGTAFINYANPLVSLQSTDDASCDSHFFGSVFSGYSNMPDNAKTPELSNFVTAASSPNIVYATDNPSGCQNLPPFDLWRSSNWGLTWSRVASLPLDAGEGIAVNPTNPLVLVAVSHDQSSPLTYWLSSDGGHSWNNVTTSCPNELDAIWWNPSNASQLIFTPFDTQSNVCISSDQGTMFTELRDSFPPPPPLNGAYPGPLSLSFVPGNVNGASFAFGPGLGLLYSPQFGQPWSPVSTNLIARDVTSIAWLGGHLLLSTYGQGVVESRSRVDPFSVPNEPTCQPTSRNGTAVTFRWSNASNVSSPPMRGYVVTPMTSSGRAIMSTWASATSSSVTVKLPISHRFHAIISSVNDVGPSVGCVSSDA